MIEYDPGSNVEPFKSLFETYPDETAFPKANFRTEWGPIFYRGRVDGTARLLLIGQDPGQHENVLRRILVGEAGRRAQGFMAKLGITRSYVMINALLYSVFGSGGDKFVDDPAIASYRNQWIDAIMGSGSIEGVVTFGGMAKTAWEVWKKSAVAPSSVKVVHLTHPTYPESAGGSAAVRAANTKKMLQAWNTKGLQVLHPLPHPDSAVPLALYGNAFADSDKADIPSFDLPPGIPAWMYDDDGWAVRGLPNKLPTPSTSAEKVQLKRSKIVITVPKGILP
jgi:uracil-DNA glycosylase